MEEVAFCNANELREVVKAIKHGDAEAEIFSLRRAFADDTDYAELIEDEWRKQ